MANNRCGYTDFPVLNIGGYVIKKEQRKRL